ncbi:MAG: hypothetical protein A2057_08070 [Ignavibacteria bacterium GWA2_35_9]|nr:MAG: hypothetical protein A2057_08070 [Ignavibacteria bacterium GWA2_35_9]OGU43102.1 MAG: hypothetical protein A2000_07635 [Ignavibacteria bacterium GWB2_36_8]OGU49199.1 MAG: hypothetical protein A2080_12465 [Ignavibacteria bacterium GWC2_36_12]
MSKNIIIAGVLLCLFMSQITFGQVQVKSTAMKQAIIFRPNQDAIRGKLAEIGEEYIVVFSSEREVTIPFADISRIILTYERGSGRGPIYGAVLAGYAGTLILTRSQDHGGFVESRDLSLYLLVVVPSIALGAGIGYLVDPGSVQKEEVFDFTGSGEAKTGEKSRLLRAATHESRESKVHITFQGSHVNSNMPKLNLPGSSTSYDYNTISEFNWLRKVQVTYSVVPEVEVGVALVWFSEPPQFSFGYETLGNSDSKSYNGFQSFEATGKYIVALYKPLYDLLDPRLDLKVGGGFGAASIDYSRTTTVWAYTQSGTGSQLNSSFSVSDNFVVAYLFVQLEFELVDGLSLGLVADKVFGPSRDAPAVSEANIPPQTLRFHNTSVGFTISLHF